MDDEADIETISLDLNSVGYKSKVLADGQELPMVTSVDVHADAENLTTATVKVLIREATADLPFDQVDLIGKADEGSLFAAAKLAVEAFEEGDKQMLQKHMQFLRYCTHPLKPEQEDG